MSELCHLCGEAPQSLCPARVPGTGRPPGPCEPTPRGEVPEESLSKRLLAFSHQFIGETRDMLREASALASKEALAQPPNCLSAEEWEALAEILANPKPAPEWLRSALAQRPAEPSGEAEVNAAHDLLLRIDGKGLGAMRQEVLDYGARCRQEGVDDAVKAALLRVHRAWLAQIDSMEAGETREAYRDAFQRALEAGREGSKR